MPKAKRPPTKNVCGSDGNGISACSSISIGAASDSSGHAVCSEGKLGCRGGNEGGTNSRSPFRRDVEIRLRSSRLVRLDVQPEETSNDNDNDHDANDIENVHVRTPIEAGDFNTEAPHSCSKRQSMNASSLVRRIDPNHRAHRCSKAESDRTKGDLLCADLYLSMRACLFDFDPAIRRLGRWRLPASSESVEVFRFSWLERLPISRNFPSHDELAHRECYKNDVKIIPATATVMTPVASHPIHRRGPWIVFSPMMSDLAVISIIVSMTGHETTPLITALQ